ncbi:MAG: helix-turn-helix domain-containing protein [Bacilli bacterium]|nr:helix-turn-helix domain-containing protein [Bacilli bacterium]
MKTIGDRIKEKRKEMGLTQAQLGETLGLTDKAISKWEQNEGNPDFATLPKLAQTLGMTLDYLISGVEPTVNLEDMDAEKRALYLIERDDAENFVKYGYSKPWILFDDLTKSSFGYESRQSRRLESTIRAAVYKSRKPNVFNELINSYLTIDKRKKESLLYGTLSSASLFYENLDDFVILCALAGRTDILDEIDFKFFAIGKRSNNDRNVNYGVIDPRCTYLISRDTLEFILTSEDVPQKVKDYLSEMEFFRVQKYQRPAQIAFMMPQIIGILYESKQFALLESALEQVKNYLETCKSLVSKECEYRDGIYMRFERNGWGGKTEAPIAFVPGVNFAITKAEENHDAEWLKKFSDFNTLVNQTFNVKCRVFGEEEIEMHRVKGNPNSDYADILKSTFIRHGIINYHEALNTAMPTDHSKEDILKSLKASLQQLDKIHEIVKDIPICFPELFESMLQKNDMKAIFMYASKEGLTSLQDAVLTNDSSVVRNWVNTFLGNVEPTDSQFAESKISETEKGNIVALRKWQSSICIPPEKVEASGFGTPDYVKKAKSYSLKKLKSILEEQIEKITQSRKREENYQRVSTKITDDYLLALVEKGDFDSAVVKLCTRLEAALQYHYGYDGELFEMLKTYTENYLQPHELHNLWDDEDNDYERFKEEDEEFMEDNKRREATSRLLHKLRIKRNHILHPAAEDTDLSQDDIKRCISIVCNM